MEVKEAVDVAKKAVIDLFGAEGIVNVGLEGVEFDMLHNEWQVTIGFSRKWDSEQLVGIGAIYGTQKSAKRTYKVVHLSDADGTLLSIKPLQEAA